jgi:hypothetical protein
VTLGCKQTQQHKPKTKKKQRSSVPPLYELDALVHAARVKDEEQTVKGLKMKGRQ